MNGDPSWVQEKWVREHWYHPQSWNAVLSTANVSCMIVYVLCGLLVPNARETFKETVVVVLPSMAGMLSIIATRQSWGVKLGKGEQKGEASGSGE